MNNNQQKPVPTVMEKIVALCKRRGFIFQSSEIYGGLNGCWDYGPLGVELKRNVKQAWWQRNVVEREDVVGLDCSILMHPMVWKASGHIDGFSDPMVDCKECKKRFRATDVKADKCPECGGPLTEPRMFNLMFRTFVGSVQDDASVTYLRPETAQGMFANFANVLNTTRIKIPFGIAQVGKGFRNEITPRNFIFRTREFEMMEIEFFCKPGTEEKWWQHWTEERMKWYVDLGIKRENLRFREHDKQELAHYAVRCVDIEYKFPWGWAELEGIGNRTDYDLRQHQRGMRSISRYTDASGKMDDVELAGEAEEPAKGPLSYFDDESRERYIPYVIEPAAGVDRSLLAFLVEAYDEEEVKGEMRTVLRLSPPLAPIKVAVFPLVKKDDMQDVARKIYDQVRKVLPAFYDEKGAIGRRYRRQDEAGTPFTVTVDGQTAEDNTVTIRDRDSMVQERIDAGAVLNYVRDRLHL